MKNWTTKIFYVVVSVLLCLAVAQSAIFDKGTLVSGRIIETLWEKNIIKIEDEDTADGEIVLTNEFLYCFAERDLEMALRVEEDSTAIESGDCV